MTHHIIIECESQSNPFWSQVTALGRTALQVTDCDPGGLGQYGLTDYWPNPAFPTPVPEVDQSILSYPFNVPADKAGNYAVCVYCRAWEQSGALDLANDGWIRMTSGSDHAGGYAVGDMHHKYFRNNDGTWGWGVMHFGGNHFIKNLPAGNHTLELAARSCHWQVDRIVIFNYDEQQSKDADWDTKAAGIYGLDSVETTLNCDNSVWGANVSSGDLTACFIVAPYNATVFGPIKPDVTGGTAPFTYRTVIRLPEQAGREIVVTGSNLGAAPATVSDSAGIVGSVIGFLGSFELNRYLANIKPTESVIVETRVTDSTGASNTDTMIFNP